MLHIPSLKYNVLKLQYIWNMQIEAHFGPFFFLSKFTSLLAEARENAVFKRLDVLANAICCYFCRDCFTLPGERFNRLLMPCLGNASLFSAREELTSSKQRAVH